MFFLKLARGAYVYYANKALVNSLSETARRKSRNWMTHLFGLSVTSDLIFIGAQFSQTHGAAGVKAIGGNTDFGT